ncbi:hypothetical protein PIROE2DRAFT_12418, partial [Piromyces sp. E2]
KNNGSSPDGNTLLNLFSSYLFKALSIQKETKDYNKGKSIAFSILCKIIFKPQRRLPINQIYLDRSYTLLAQGLDSDFLSVTSIIKNSRTLFQQELKGSRLLFPDYIRSIFKLLPKIFTNDLLKSDEINYDEDFDYLRLSCYVILSNIYAYPNHFYEIPIRDELQNDDVMDGTRVFMSENIHNNCFAIYKRTKDSDDKLTFGSLKPVILEILLSSLQNETNENNINFLLYLIYCYIYDDIKNTKGLLKTVNELIVNTVILKNNYSLKLTKDAIDTLFDLSLLHNFDTAYEPHQLIMKFCVYIDTLLMEDNIVPYQYIICKTYEIILSWIINGSWISKYRNCFSCVILILSKGIYYSNKQSFVNMTNVVNLINMEGKDALDEALSEFIHHKLIKKNSVALNLTNSKMSTKDGISTSTEDGGVGVPTFAILSSALMIETVSEVCLNKILNYYGAFPPYGNNTSVCNTGSLWKEDDELIELIKLKYNKNKNFQLHSKNKEEIIQLFLEQEEDNDIIQYYSLNNEIIVGVLSLPTWYVNIKKKAYIKNSKPVVKSNSTNSGIVYNFKENNNYKRSSSEILSRGGLFDNENGNENTFNYNSRECCSPERVVLFEYDNPNLQYHPLVRKQSETSLYEVTMESPVGKDNRHSDSDELPVTGNINSPASETDVLLSIKQKKKDECLNSPDYLSIHPMPQSNNINRESVYSNKGIKSIDEKNVAFNILFEKLPTENEELKDKFVAYIVRNFSGKYSWISSLKYENNKILDQIKNTSNIEIITTLLSESSESSTNIADNSNSLSKSKEKFKIFNSTSNVKLSQDIIKFDDESKDNESTNTNEFNEYQEQVIEQNKEFKILNCTCFNESELPSNYDIINDGNRKSYNKVEKISEILYNSEEKIMNERNINNKEFKKINKVEMPKCRDMNDSEENFISLENYNFLTPLKKSINLFKKLNELDQMSSRDQFTFSVFYVANEDCTIEDIFQPKFINKDFKSFIYSMCWLVNPQNHSGFLGGFNKNSKQNIPYYANDSIEMILHIPYFIDDSEFCHTDSPSSDTNINQKEFINGFKEFTKNNNVFIIWMGKNDINAPKVLHNLYQNGLTAKIYYIIYPYNYTKGLFKIKIYKTKSVKSSNTLKRKLKNETLTVKKQENEKSRTFHNSKSYEVIDSNSKSRNLTVDYDQKIKNLEKVYEETSNESLNSNNDSANSNSNPINTNYNNPTNATQEPSLVDNINNTTDNQKSSINNNMTNITSPNNNDDRKNSYAIFSNDTLKKVTQQNQLNSAWVTFRPVLIENKQSKKPISNKDSQSVYIPKTDKPKQ